MKIVAIIPIKLNNSRLPGKNIKPFTNGKPLCWYIFNTMLSIKEIDDIYVYCSSNEIVNYIPKGIKFLKRPENLDLDSTSMTEVLSNFVKEVDSDIYVMSHATSPFISAQSIQKGINAVMNCSYDSAFAVTKVQDFLWENGKPMNYQLDNIPRTQDLPKIYMETSGFYIFKKEVMCNLKRRIGNIPYMVEVEQVESIDIDEAEDFLIADAIFSYKEKNRG